MHLAPIALVLAMTDRACTVGSRPPRLDDRPSAESATSYLYSVLAAGLQQGRTVRRLEGGVAAGVPLNKAVAQCGTVLHL